MSAPALDKALIDQRWQAYAQAVAEGYRARNVMRPKTVESALVIAAQRLDISYNTLRETITRCEIEGYSLDGSAPIKAQYESDTRPFISPSVPSQDDDIDSIIERKRKVAKRAIEADDARTLVPVRLTMAGPVGLFLMGDPHVDNDGCDWPALERDLALVERQPRVMAINMGDVLDNWVGRLEKLHAMSSTKASEGWKLAEWIFNRPVNWLALIGGNHDAWSGHRDPLKWITRSKVPLYEANAARLGFQHPNGRETRFHGRHTFRGNSMYSNLHGLRREMREGWRDHIIAAAHLHSGEDGAQINGDGFVTQLIRLSGYKRVDSYAREIGFKSQPMHASALVIINPDVPDNSRSRVWLAPDIETGVDYLNFLHRRGGAQ